jgi:hypothetical protein
VWIGGDEILRARIQIGEVASPAPGDVDLFADPLGVFKYNYAAAAPAGFNRTKETCRPAPDDDNISLMHAQVFCHLLNLERREQVVGHDVEQLPPLRFRLNGPHGGQKANKPTCEALSEPEAVATGSGWIKTSLRNLVFCSQGDPVATAPGSDIV